MSYWFGSYFQWLILGWSPFIQLQSLFCSRERPIHKVSKLDIHLFALLHQEKISNLVVKIWNTCTYNYVHYILAWLSTNLSDDVRFASGIMDLSFRTIRLPPFDWQNSLAFGHDNEWSYFKILSGCGASDFTESNKSTYLLCFEIWQHVGSLIFARLSIPGISLYFLLS